MVDSMMTQEHNNTLTLVRAARTTISLPEYRALCMRWVRVLRRDTGARELVVALNAETKERG